MKIYLAGSVPKGDKEAAIYQDWRQEFAKNISAYVKNVELFDPNIFSKLEGNSLAVTGADCHCIKQSDLVIVNATEKLGAGTAMELVVAKYLQKPVITVLPKNTHHRRSNIQFNGKLVSDWIHPFIETFSDYIIEDIIEIKNALKYIEKNKPKTITIINEAIKYAEDLLNEKNDHRT